MITIRDSRDRETLVFTDNIEKQALNQIEILTEYEAYSDSVIRIMPDVHAGKGCTIGTTMTIRNRVTPNLVGVDIGCGMLTINIGRTQPDSSRLDQVIRRAVPSGFSTHKKPVARFDFSSLRCQKHVDTGRAKLSIGTLGGGNHFIEVARGEKSGNYYLIIHSGSRKLGTEVCEHYQHMAIARLKERLGKAKLNMAERDLAYLEGSGFNDYMHDMAIVQRYASYNRATMAAIITEEMNVTEEERFETIHNYIDFKRMILRKGAVSAEEGERLLIPLNMRDGSLLCIGKGNSDWNYSAPHGAGRLMSRNKARALININDFREAMKGIHTSTVGKATIDEAPQAYKPMKEIIDSIGDTAILADHLKTVYNFKALS